MSLFLLRACYQKVSISSLFFFCIQKLLLITELLRIWKGLRFGFGACDEDSFWYQKDVGSTPTETIAYMTYTYNTLTIGYSLLEKIDRYAFFMGSTSRLLPVPLIDRSCATMRVNCIGRLYIHTYINRFLRESFRRGIF
jgi:hypothetical protein